MTTAVLTKLDEFFTKQKMLAYKKDEMIIRADDEPAGVYFLKSGFVRLGSIFANGGELTFNIFKPGSFFPMMWAIGEMKNAYFYQAMSEVTVYKAPRLKVVKFVKDNQDVLFDLTRRILIAMDGLLTNAQYLLFGSSYNRIAAAMLILSKRFGEKTKDGRVLVNVELTHQDIACLAGVTRETASIAIGQLEKRNLVGRLKKKFIISNVRKLGEEIFVADNNPTAGAAI